MAVGYRGDNIFRPEGGVTTKKHLGIGGLESGLVHHRHIPLVELDTQVALYPGKGILLADGHQHIVRLHEYQLFSGGHQAALAVLVVMGLDLLEQHALQLAVLDHDLLGHMIVVDRYALVHGIFLLPGRGLHILEGTAHHDPHVLAPQAPGGTTAIHGRVATTQHQHSLAYALGVLEGDAGQPVDAQVHMIAGILQAGQVEALAARSAGTDKHRVVILVQYFPQAVHLYVEGGVHTHVENVIDLLVQYAQREAKRGNLAAHHAATGELVVVDIDDIAEGRQVARHRE